MHLIYVDESGDDGFKEDNDYSSLTTPRQFFIRTALIVHDMKWQTVNQKIEALKKRWQILPNVELHATEILNGREKKHDSNTKKRIDVPNFYGTTFPDRSRRKDLLLDVCRLIKNLDVTVIGVIIDKAKIQQGKNGDHRSLPKNNSWEFLVERMNLFLSSQRDQRGMIISDAIQNQIEREHREFIKALYAQSMHIKQSYFVESILFEPSESSLLLQLADIVAYAFHRKFNMNDASCYDIIQDRLFTHQGALTGVGLKIWPSN